MSFQRNQVYFSSSNVSADTTVKRHFKVRMGEHLGISALTGKGVKSDDDSAIKEHLLFCNHSPDFEDFSTLTTNKTNLKLL